MAIWKETNAVVRIIISSYFGFHGLHQLVKSPCHSAAFYIQLLRISDGKSSNWSLRIVNFASDGGIKRHQRHLHLPE